MIEKLKEYITKKLNSNKELNNEDIELIKILIENEKKD